MPTDDTHSLGAWFKHWRLQKGWPLEVLALKIRIPVKYLRALESNDFSTLPPIEPLHHTLGELLREHRTRQGLSIESIAERTRVPLTTLHALEDNNSKNLPEAPVIIRAFVEAYLNCLNLPESEKDAVLIQFAKMVNSVYDNPRHERTDLPPPVGRGVSRPTSTPWAVWLDQLHDRALGVYVCLTDWRTTFCRRAVSAGRTTCAYAGRFLDRAGSLSADIGRTAPHKIAGCAVELMARIRPDGGWRTLWQRTVTALIACAQQIRRAYVSVHHTLAPLVHRWFARHHPIENGTSSGHASPTAPQGAHPLEGKSWTWLAQYGVTIVLLLMLGSTASTIPLFKDTALADTKLAASNLVAFIGYGGALLMLWLMGRNGMVYLVRNTSGLAFLRPLGAPFNALLGVSALYKLLLTLVGPSLGKADRLAYNWIFVSLILAATLWLIRTWFLKSAPLLDSQDATGHPKQPGRIAVASLRD